MRKNSWVVISTFIHIMHLKPKNKKYPILVWFVGFLYERNLVIGYTIDLRIELDKRPILLHIHVSGTLNVL